VRDNNTERGGGNRGSKLNTGVVGCEGGSWGLQEEEKGGEEDYSPSPPQRHHAI